MKAIQKLDSISDVLSKSARTNITVAYDSVHFDNFLAAHILYRFIRDLKAQFFGEASEKVHGTIVCEDIHHLDVKSIDSPGLLILVNPIITSNQVRKYLTQFAHVLIITNKHNAEEVFHHGFWGGPPQQLTIVKEDYCESPNLEYSMAMMAYQLLFDSQHRYPTFMHVLLAQRRNPTMVTTSMQEMLNLGHNHDTWFERYPDLLFVATKVGDIGELLYDDSKRVTRLIRDSSFVHVDKQDRRALYVMSPPEDITACHEMLLTFVGNHDIANIDYHVIYSSTGNGLYYEVFNHNSELNLPKLFHRYGALGNHRRVTIRRTHEQIGPTRTGIFLG